MRGTAEQWFGPFTGEPPSSFLWPYCFPVCFRKGMPFPDTAPRGLMGEEAPY